VSGYRFQCASRAPRLGEDIAAIGFPLSLPLTATRGSVSGLNRRVAIDGVMRGRLVQTDAAINHGNSGGPLITNNGAVVGLVDLGSDQAHGLAFAVSADVAGPLIKSWAIAPQPLAAPDCSYDSYAAGAGSESQATTTETTASTPPTYNGAAFSIQYPAGWVVSAAEVDHGSYIDTTINPPASGSMKIRVDVNPAGGSSSLMEAAAPVLAALRRDPTYRELSLTYDSFLGGDSLRWEFTVIENGITIHKIDEFFFDTNGGEWAVLIQAPEADWNDVADALDSYRQTLELH
jgi:S1-C subfamily serine protease